MFISFGNVVHHGPASVVRGVLVVLPHVFGVVCAEVSSLPPCSSFHSCSGGVAYFLDTRPKGLNKIT